MAQEGARSRLNTPGKILGVGAGFLLLLGGAYWLVFHGDLQTALDSERTKGDTLRRENEASIAAEHAYQRDLADLTARQQRQGELAKILPQTAESAGFLSSLQNVANLVGVNLQGWTPQAEVPQTFYAKVPMKLHLSGRYHQVARFFYSVGQLERIINMENISLLEPTLQGDDVVVKVDVLATAFHLLSATQEESKNPRQAKERRP